MTSLRRILTSIGTIGVSLLVASLLGVVLLAVVARWLTPDQNAAFITIWGVIFSGGSVLSVIEQESARQVTVAKERDQKTPASVIQLAVLGLVGALLGIVLLALLPFGKSVFGSSFWVILFTYVAVSGFSVQYLTRGILLGLGRNTQYAVVIFLEAGLRLVAAVAFIAVGLKPSVLLAVIAVCIGSFGWVPVVKTALMELDIRFGLERWRTAIKRVAVMAASAALLAPLLTGYPTLVSAVLGSSSGLATFFAIVSVSRIPLVLVAPVQALVVPITTRMILGGRQNALKRLQVLIVGVIVSCAALGYVVAWFCGPWAVELIFGDNYKADPALVAIMLAVTVIMAGSLLQVAVFISLERYYLIGVTWGISLVSSIVSLLMVPGNSVFKAAAGFVTIAVVSYVTSSIALQRSLAE